MERIGPYLADIPPGFEAFVEQVFQAFAQRAYSIKLQTAKSGHVVSFVHPKTKAVAANFISRKSGPVIRLYGDYAAAYLPELEALPAPMKANIKKAGPCRRLLDPTACNARCPMGYAFPLEGEEQVKCRYGCFMFVMNRAQTPGILALVEAELAARG